MIWFNTATPTDSVCQVLVCNSEGADLLFAFPARFAWRLNVVLYPWCARIVQMSNTPKLPRGPSSRNEPPILPLVLLVCVMVVGAFFGLLAIVFPGIGFMGIALLLLGFFFWLQYLVWGKWIYAYAVRKEREQQMQIEQQMQVRHHSAEDAANHN